LADNSIKDDSKKKKKKKKNSEAASLCGTSNVSRNLKYQFKTRMIDRGSFIRTDDQWL
jgi:hypothetical protein